jgi:predicted HTH domain antitoxin
MAVTKVERIEIDLPADIIFAMHATDKPEEIQKKLKMALAIFLFQEGSISLGKATELAEMNRVRFIEVLAEHGIAAYEYSEKDFERDQQAVAAYRHAIECC